MLVPVDRGTHSTRVGLVFPWNDRDQVLRCSSKYTHRGDALVVGLGVFLY